MPASPSVVSVLLRALEIFFLYTLKAGNDSDAAAPTLILPTKWSRDSGALSTHRQWLMNHSARSNVIRRTYVHPCFQLWPASRTLVLSEGSVGFDCLRSRIIRVFFTN